MLIAKQRSESTQSLIGQENETQNQDLTSTSADVEPDVSDDDDEEEDHEGYCLSEEHHRLVRSTSLEYPNRRQAICRFALGSLMAFGSGLTLTVNNMVIKKFDIDFGELLAVRSIVQIPLMLIIASIKGHSMIPTTTLQKILTGFVGVFGALTMLCTFSCVKFMPVGDAMTLIFTSPLFTIIFAAVFLKHKLSFVKIAAASVLMAGIVLVTKPPFIFPQSLANETQTLTPKQFLKAFVSTDHFQSNFKVVNWSDTAEAKIEVGPEATDLYFVGALIALGASISSAANNIVMAKLGRGVPTSVQLFYIAIVCFVISLICQLLDQRDRFFSKEIFNISPTEFGICVGISLIGMCGFFCTIRSLSLVPPSTVATLRTSQIIVAFIAQIIMTGFIPGILDILGAGLIFLAAVVITLESQIIKLFKCGRR